MRCDADGCTNTAVAVLAFRGMPGHVHVCAMQESIDREWGDVVASAAMPCPAGCESTDHAVYHATPTLLT
ncbi:hypothetical protein LJR042_003544 [Microbacterium maritypicum]|uniref:hypothetical protein n=1 Tax=Microbacterium maritypicum TaxID=33918 RepID=UPI003ECE6FA2